MESCLYEGRVRHRRHGDVAHAFSFPLAMLYLDLDEQDAVFRGRWAWSARRPALAWFRRADHVGPATVPLADAVRDLVAARTGARPTGPVRLLTHPRYAGYVFNPLSLFFCFGPDGRRLEAVVADVTNTPWGERHQYVLDAGGAAGGSASGRWRHAKAFHVSPFLPMALDYEWRIAGPGASLAVRIAARPHGAREDSAPSFVATLALRRRAIDGRSLAGVLVRFPLQTAQVVVAIYAHALRLWWRGARVHPHPRTEAAPMVPGVRP
jgi:hypothetical protein